MTHRKLENGRRVPDPQMPSWYWYRQSAKLQWEPVMVIPKTRALPAAVQSFIHSPDVSDVKGEWGELIPYPDEENNAD